MPAKKIVFHVGLPRTGTTALQEHLTKTGCPGIVFPASYKNSENTGHHEFHAELTNNPSGLRQEIFRIVASARKEEVLLFSSENLHRNIAASERIYDEFFSILEDAVDCGVEIIFSTRPLMDVLWSIYLQSIRDLEATFPGRYDEYFPAAVAEAVGNTLCFLRLRSKYPVHFLDYSQEHLIQDFICSVTGRTDEVNASVGSGSHVSATPSLLLHGFLHRMRQQKKSVSPALWWLMIGADLDGNFFPRSGNYFKNYDNDAFAQSLATVEWPGVEKLPLNDQRSLKNLLGKGHYLAQDITSPIKQHVNFGAAKNHLTYLVNHASQEGVSVDEVRGLMEIVNEYEECFQ
jgi:hypothetical protein